MKRRVVSGKLVEVFEELKISGTWIVPKGTDHVDAFVVAGGKNGDNSSIYSAGNGGKGGQAITYNNIKVIPGQSITIVVGGPNQDSYFKDANFKAVSGYGANGGTNFQHDNYNPTPGGKGDDGILPFNNAFPQFHDKYGAGGGAGAYIRGFNQGLISGGEGGQKGGGKGASASDANGIMPGNRGGNATFYGGGGGGASKASGQGASNGVGGEGYQGIIILHYWKYE